MNGKNKWKDYLHTRRHAAFAVDINDKLIVVNTATAVETLPLSVP